MPTETASASRTGEFTEVKKCDGCGKAFWSKRSWNGISSSALTAPESTNGWFTSTGTVADSGHNSRSALDRAHQPHHPRTGPTLVQVAD